MIFRLNDNRFDALQLSVLLSELALTGPLSVVRVARHLGTSPRTFQRRLAAQRLSFRTLTEEVRVASARILLCKTDMPVQDIALGVGYRTPNSFARAFGRSTGRSPREYRTAMRQSMKDFQYLARNGQNAEQIPARVEGLDVTERSTSSADFKTQSTLHAGKEK